MNSAVGATIGATILVATLSLLGGCSNQEQNVEPTIPDDVTAVASPGPTNLNPLVPPATTPLPTVGQTPSSNDDIPADWETYVDPELSFSLGYPPELEVQTRYSDLANSTLPIVQLRTLTFSDAAGIPAISVFVAPNARGLTAEAWNDTFPGCCFGKPQPVSVGGEQGLLFPEGALDGNPRVLVQHEGHIFGLAGYVNAIPDSPAAPILTDSEFRLVVRSFKFAP